MKSSRPTHGALQKKYLPLFYRRQMRIPFMKKISRFLIATAVAAVLFCNRASAAGPESSHVESTLVRTAVVTPAETAARGFTGLVAARVQSNLGFRVSGKIVKRFVDAGEKVTRGQAMMQLDAKDLKLQLVAKQKTVAAARALAVQARADEVRYRKLAKDGWATQQKYDQIVAQLDSANAKLSAAEAEAAVSQNEVNYSVLHADVDGTVVNTLAEPGQVVTAGQTVIELAERGPREALLHLPETLRPDIGSMAMAQLYGSQTTIQVKLRQLSDAADPISRTYEARYVLSGDTSTAPLGATIRVWLKNTSSQPVSKIPLGAIYDDGERTGVWIIDKKSMKISFKNIILQGLGAEDAFVTGLANGTMIVALGAHTLHEGETIRFNQEKVAAND
ncbi:efflux RND transporter periplasmic adaptor subunit [Thalassospira mesophila]|nr:efflux RND transporter periplasmic adaptor subunit [Thalassospira mesophila]